MTSTLATELWLGPDLDPATCRAALLAICDRATSAEDAREMARAAGLLPDPYSNLGMTPGERYKLLRELREVSGGVPA